MAVSALDQYVREVVRLGMLDVYMGRRIRTDAFLRFQVSLGSVMRRDADANSATADSAAWLDDQLRERHGHQSFQTPGSIADAVRLISGAQLWNEVAERIGMNQQSARRELRLIINRRNQIVHEADANPSYPGALWPIDALMADDAVGFIEQVAEGIHSVVARNSG